MRFLTRFTIVLLSSFAVFSNLEARVIRATCDTCNPASGSDDQTLAILENVLLENIDMRNGDTVKITRVDALTEGGNCVQNCTIVASWVLVFGDMWGANGYYFTDGNLQGEPVFSGGGGGVFYPDIIPTFSPGWSFTCSYGSVPISCSTGEPLTQ